MSAVKNFLTPFFVNLSSCFNTYVLITFNKFGMHYHSVFMVVAAYTEGCRKNFNPNNGEFKSTLLTPHNVMDVQTRG